MNSLELRLMFIIGGNKMVTKEELEIRDKCEEINDTMQKTIR